MQIGAIHLDARRLHVEQHRHEAAFNLLIQRQSLLFAQTRLEQLPQPQGDVGVLGGVVGGEVERHLRKGDAAFAGAGHAVIGNRRVAEMQVGQFVHPMPMRPGIKRVGDQHGVVERADLGDPGTGEDGEVVFRVLENLQHRAVTQQRGEHGQRVVHRNLCRLCLMPQRDVARHPSLGCQREAGEVGVASV